MPKLRFHYFDFPGGRGEPARIALRFANIDFEDIRFPAETFVESTAGFMLKQVPVLEIDGQQITQSNAINRYVGKLAGLYPKTDFEQLLCDETMDIVEDITTKIVPTFFMQGEQKKSAREDLCQNIFPKYLKFLEQKLTAAGGEYFADKRLTMADLKTMMLTAHLCSGALDHVPKDIVSQYAPLLVEHITRVSQHPVYIKGQ